MVKRGKRRVRLHPADQRHPTVEGIEVSRRLVGGHYVLAAAKILPAVGETVSLDGLLEVPADRVLYREVIG